MAVTVRCEGRKAPTGPVKTDARRLLKRVDLVGGELSIVLCDDPFIHALNRQWRAVDSPTDVLSFAMNEGVDAELHPELLGDVIISLDTAERQAAEQGHSLHREVRVLLVHGFLHLLGYDHIEPDDATEMAEAERKLLVMLEGASPGAPASAVAAGVPGAEGLVGRASLGE